MQGELVVKLLKLRLKLKLKKNSMQTLLKMRIIIKCADKPGLMK